MKIAVHLYFASFYQDRSTEHAKTGKDWKFSLLQALHHSPHIELLVEAIPTRIHELIREGYVELCDNYMHCFSKSYLTCSQRLPHPTGSCWTYNNGAMMYFTFTYDRFVLVTFDR